MDYYGLRPGMGVEWIERDEGIFLMPVPEDPIGAFRGASRGDTQALLDHRKADKKKE